MQNWKYTPFSDGYCKQLEAFAIKGGRIKMIRFPSFMALLQHPIHGNILFDGGYSKHFFSSTKHFPYRFYRWLTPVTLNPNHTAKEFLDKIGINRLQHIIVSHFHADHMGALRDFPEAAFICTRQGFESIRLKRGLAALKQAYLPDLLPQDFPQRAQFIEETPIISLQDEWLPFATAKDLFGDQSMLAIDLPGHAAGQVGIAFKDDNEITHFLVSDACWQTQAYQQNLPPAGLGWRLQHDREDYSQTLNKLYQLHKRSPHISIVPTHAEQPVLTDRRLDTT